MKLRARVRSTAAAAGLGLLLSAAAGCEGQAGRGGITESRLGVLIDSLLPGIASASGLEAREPVRYALQPRSEVRSYLERQLEQDLGAAELAGAERAYRAFGLIPDTLDLRSFLLELYSEQVVGYYDPREDRLYVVEGVSERDAAPVIAHELVHALQDQLVDLDSLVAPERGNDRQMAAQAAAEGQATLVMMALETARRTGRPVDPGDLPDLGPMLAPALEAENARFPVFGRAPRLIRETLIFPYFDGAAFVQRLHRHAGNGPVIPFGDDLPQSTEQVLDPERRFLGERDHPTELELGDPPEGWSAVYSNTLGQYEVGILLAEHRGEAARGASEGWDGDRYVLLESSDGGEALVWYTVWDDVPAADRFARELRAAMADGSGRSASVDRLDVDARPVVRLVDLPAGSGPAGLDRVGFAAPGIRAMREGD